MEAFNDLQGISICLKSFAKFLLISYKQSPDSSCLLTDLVQHEDSNNDEKLDYSEFQSAFNKLFSMFSLEFFKLQI